MAVEIRLVEGADLLSDSHPLTSYAFDATPQPQSDQPAETARGQASRRTHVAFDDGVAAATAAVIPMTQQLRGQLVAMGAVAGVATDPRARRRGHARSLLTHVLADMRAQGQVVSTLYPFRPSFYQRLGYVGLPQPVTARLRPGDFTGLLQAPLGGTVTCHRISEAFDEYWDFVTTVQRQTAGMALRARDEAAANAARHDEWLAFARVGGEVTGAMRYRISGFAGTLAARCFFHLDVRARMLLLQWLAQHTDQVTEVALRLPSDAAPELWHSDVEVTVEKKTAIPDHNAPMARVHDVTGLAGMRVGEGSATVRVVDELLPAAAGTYTFEADNGVLSVRPGGSPTATLTPAGLTGLVYGVLDPDELALRGFGDADAATTGTLRSLFPRTVPYLYETF